MNGMTDQQERIYAFVREFRRDNGFPPTRAEIARHFGFASANAAEEHLRAIERKGLIRICRGVARGIALTD